MVGWLTMELEAAGRPYRSSLTAAYQIRRGLNYLEE